MTEKYNKNNIPELLAPAGSIESFNAAIDAGADAVYCGLLENNARIRAKNFTLKTLSYLIPYAHSNGLKVYITLNTLIKQNELKNAVNTVFQLEDIGADALIVQDLGLASIIRMAFPKFALHASTQMTVHNSPGVDLMEKTGFRRVILERELSIEEISLISKNTALELEVFIHGAVCYSFSGLCLASSYMGGASGNRGMCKQVCRQRISFGNKAGYYFSPPDLQALDYIADYRRIGIKSLKIEGRMKSPDYVYTAVSAYRKLLDHPEKTDEVREELKYDLGRKKTSLFLGSYKNRNIIDPLVPPGTGLFTGTVGSVGSDFIGIKTEYIMNPGDSLRIMGNNDLAGHTLKITKTSTDDGILNCFTGEMPGIKKGDAVYLSSRKNPLLKRWKRKSINVKPARYRTFYPAVPGMISKYAGNPAQNHLENETLYIRFDSLRWLDIVKKYNYSGFILGFEPEEFRELIGDRIRYRDIMQKSIAALPPFIPETDISMWKKLLLDLRNTGICRFMCAHAGQKYIIPENSAAIADSTIWALNRAAQRMLTEMGYSSFTYSPEDDLLNLKAAISSTGMISLFSMIPLFISRICPPVPGGVPAGSEHVFTVTRHGLWYSVGKEPFSLTHRKIKLKELGINKFILDLSFCAPEERLFKDLLGYYKSGARMPGTSLFNHKGGLK